ncbi:unnamed protein product [Prorocentrum cordatum]|uniref:Peptidyl-prolyl cis-trans isomerase n=1 Tax=Prorocentrum cordatum TaxID=2364126 RepID=A0ABN9QU61_9DINO|nr:unnamed protein product [Polarella glacialis]
MVAICRWLAVICPSLAAVLAQAGPTATVSCDTTIGQIDIEIFREWSPKGADHFLELVQDGWYTDIALFRAVPNFLVQFGINTDASMRQKWERKTIDDDPSQNIAFERGTVSYAGSGPNSRGTHVFFSLGAIPLGESPWETPFGRVAAHSLEVMDKIYTGYGDMPPWGEGPNPQEINQRGNSYVREDFPKVDFIKSCKVATMTSDASVKSDDL